MTMFMELLRARSTWFHLVRVSTQGGQSLILPWLYIWRTLWEKKTEMFHVTCHASYRLQATLAVLQTMNITTIVNSSTENIWRKYWKRNWMIKAIISFIIHTWHCQVSPVTWSSRHLWSKIENIWLLCRGN